MDLYIAERSDRSDIVKIGRSDDVPRRCREIGTRRHCTVPPLVTFHHKGEWERRAHDVLRHRMMRIGQEREWFRASWSDTIAAVSLVIHDPPTPMINADRMLQRIQPARKASKGSTASDIEDLASSLFGDDWKGGIAAAGLQRKRTQKFEGEVRVPVYKYVYPDGKFVVLKSASEADLDMVDEETPEIDCVATHHHKPPHECAGCHRGRRRPPHAAAGRCMSRADHRTGAAWP